MPLKAPDRWWMLPDALKQRNQWVLTNADKLPVDFHTKKLAKTDDPMTWATYEEIKNEPHIGFVLVQLCGVDFDKILKYATPFCLRAQWWLQKFAKVTYCEYSISGKGAHVFGFCQQWALPISGTTVADPDSPEFPNKAGRMVHDVKVEFAQPTIEGDIDAGDCRILRGRHYVITGNSIEGCPSTVADISDLFEQFYTEFHEQYAPTPVHKERPLVTDRRESALPADLSDQQLLGLIQYAKNGDKFMDLYHGNISGYPSQSEADMAFCAMLAFYTSDYARILRFVEASGLMRPKWEHESYQRATIQKAIDGVTDHYKPRAGKPTPGEALQAIQEL